MESQNIALNVLGEPLQICCMSPITGFYRNGKCETGTEDRGTHVVCAEITAEFLEFTKARGNDLSSPSFSFPGLKPGDRWCLCVSRWQEALVAGVAPPIILESTHQAALKSVSLEQLKANGVKTNI
jgi:uncharacterized protein